jgi:hypothetical protein
VIETGTYRGTTTEWFAEKGLPTYSIEANRQFFVYSLVRFGRTKNVHVSHGDSRAFLRQLARKVDVEASGLFYLDAHWDADLPLREEIETITGRWRRPVLMIDDFQVPWDDGYGYDDYGHGAKIGIEILPPLDGFDCYLPSDPANAETGMRRGCAVLVPASERKRMASCPYLRNLSAGEA